MVVKTKDKPKWFKIRRQIATFIVNMAKKIYPESPEVVAFHAQVMTDAMITGGAVVRVDPEKVFHGKGAVEQVKENVEENLNAWWNLLSTAEKHKISGFEAETKRLNGYIKRLAGVINDRDERLQKAKKVMEFACKQIGRPDPDFALPFVCEIADKLHKCLEELREIGGNDGN